MLNKKRQLALQYYTDTISPQTFLNATKSYAKVFPNAKYPNKSARKLFGIPKFHKALEGKTKNISGLFKEDFLLYIEKEYKNSENKDLTRLRALELLGKVMNYIKPEVNNTGVTIISDLESQRWNEAKNRMFSKEIHREQR